MSFVDSPTREDGYWFSLLFTHSDLPAEWALQEDLQRSIACFEMLAQTLLLLLARGQLAGGSGRVYIPAASDAPGGTLHTASDNMPTVGASQKM